jgi:hypothetical protein
LSFSRGKGLDGWLRVAYFTAGACVIAAIAAWSARSVCTTLGSSPEPTRVAH